MKQLVKAALRGGFADEVTVCLMVWAAYEFGRAQVTRKIAAQSYAEGMMDACRGSKN